MENKYDFLIVGSGLFGAVFSYEMTKKGKRCLIIEQREHVGGNVYTKEIEGINVHMYGAHIFHTSNKEIWDYINTFADFNNFINMPLADYKGKRYNLPFNMYTFTQLWSDVNTVEQAQEKIKSQTKGLLPQFAKNLEEKAISLVGEDVYKTLIKGYTEKQWGRTCDSLPSFIIERLPVRFTFDNNYFNDLYQGIPIGGYTAIIEKMLKGVDVITGTTYKSYIETKGDFGGVIIYTGAIDEYYNYKYGRLDYRSLRFETEVLDCKDYQGNAVVNYTDISIPYTRIIEHKHFEFGDQEKTVITKEYPQGIIEGCQKYYPINDNKNTELYKKYKKLASLEKNIYFCGRLGSYGYYDMDKTILNALDLSKKF